MAPRAVRPTQLWRRLEAGPLGSLLLCLLLTLVVVDSTVFAGWVAASGRIRPVGIAAVAVLGALALWRRLKAPLALAIGLAFGLAAAFWAVAPSRALTDPLGSSARGAASALLSRLLAGEVTYPTVFIFLLAAAMWLAGGWLTFLTLRFREPVIGFMPASVVVATNLLNYPRGQAGYLLAFIVLVPALLMWSGYWRALDSARRLGALPMGASRRHYWQHGATLAAVALVLGLVTPPLTSTDRTVGLQAGVFQDWSQAVNRLNEGIGPGSGFGGAESTGFVRSVRLGSPVKQSGVVVFTYAPDPHYAGPYYFRGLNLYSPVDGRWSSQGVAERVFLAPNSTPLYSESYLDTASASFSVDLLRPPSVAPDLLFYPGQLLLASRSAYVGQELPLPQTGSGALESVDELEASNGSAEGSYRVDVTYSNPTASELEGDTTAYPAWVRAYLKTTVTDPWAAASEAKIRQLALQITSGATNAYDRATAIQTYLRTFAYTLTPPAAPHGQDPLLYFLLRSHAGYCAYFATAMGDMLMSLGIPTRLVNGYGPGTYDAKLKRFVVRELDAHTWVEVYFPQFGWVPFEPTPQPGYGVIGRRLEPSSACAPGQPCPTAPALSQPSASAGAVKTKTARSAGNQAGEVAGLGLGIGGFRIPGPPWQVPWAVLAALLAAAFVAAQRFLTPASVPKAWRRTLALSRIAGVKVSAVETPLEAAARISRAFPELEGDLASLALQFTIAAYAPPDLARRASSRMDAWAGLRPALLRRVGRRPFDPPRAANGS